jgi:hypothetical protein
MTPCHYSRILLFSSLYPFASAFSRRSLRLCGENSGIAESRENLRNETGRVVCGVQETLARILCALVVQAQK